MPERIAPEEDAATTAYYEAVESTLADHFGGRAEEELIEQGSTGDARRCRRHPFISTSSPDGLFDTPCRICEAEMEGE